MREIKFRAWDGKQIIPWVEMCMLGLNQFWYTVSPYILLQYTGLKDKNGREIFEGDILHYSHKKYLSAAGNYLVKWVTSNGECGFLCERDYPEYNFMLPKVWKKMEVIGNIYENPELIKEEH